MKHQMILGLNALLLLVGVEVVSSNRIASRLKPLISKLIKNQRQKHLKGILDNLGVKEGQFEDKSRQCGESLGEAINFLVEPQPSSKYDEILTLNPPSFAKFTIRFPKITSKKDRCIALMALVLAGASQRDKGNYKLWSEALELLRWEGEKELKKNPSYPWSRLTRDQAIEKIKENGTDAAGLIAFYDKFVGPTVGLLSYIGVDKDVIIKLMNDPEEQDKLLNLSKEANILLADGDNNSKACEKAKEIHSLYFAKQTAAPDLDYRVISNELEKEECHSCIGGGAGHSQVEECLETTGRGKSDIILTALSTLAMNEHCFTVPQGYVSLLHELFISFDSCRQAKLLYYYRDFLDQAWMKT